MKLVVDFVDSEFEDDADVFEGCFDLLLFWLSEIISSSLVSSSIFDIIRKIIVY